MFDDYVNAGRGHAPHSLNDKGVFETHLATGLLESIFLRRGQPNHLFLHQQIITCGPNQRILCMMDPIPIGVFDP